MSDDAQRKRDDKAHADHGVPTPPPHEEQATGAPTDDRLQSEVPQRGDSTPGKP